MHQLGTNGQLEVGTTCCLHIQFWTYKLSIKPFDQNLYDQKSLHTIFVRRPRLINYATYFLMYILCPLDVHIKETFKTLEFSFNHFK